MLSPNGPRPNPESAGSSWRPTRRETVIALLSAMAGGVTTRVFEKITGTTRNQNEERERLEDVSDKPVDSTEKLTKANELLRKIPDTMAGASVEKVEVDGAKYIVVHVTDVHHVSKEPTDDKELEKSVELVQLENANVLRELMPILETNVIYVEFMTPERERGFQDHMALVRSERMTGRAADASLQKARAYVERLQIEKGEDDPEVRRARKILESSLEPFEHGKAIQKNNYELYRRITGAAGALALEGNAILRPASSEGMLNVEIPKGISPADETLRKELFSDRERNVIGVLAEENGQNAKILVFGAKHDFKEVVAVWNKEHPTRKISLAKVLAPSVSTFLSK